MKKRKLKEIANVYNGNSINAKTKSEKYCFNVPAWNYIGTKDIDFDGTVNYDTGVKIPFEEKGFKIAPANCVFVCSEGGSAGKKTAHITQEVCFGNKLYAIVNDKNLFVSKYVYYYTRYREFFEQFKALMSGIIGGVSSKKFGEIEIPLPSLQEQQRIVAKIEELFSKLDKGVEELNKIKEQLKIYRQAVLKEAFEGKFLSSNSVPRYYFLENFIEKPRYGTSKKCSYENDNSTPVYRIPNIDIQRNTINKEDLKFAKLNETEFEPLALNEGDILIIRSNGSVSLVGRAAIIQKQDLSGLFAGYLMRLRIRDFSKLNPKYLIHFLNSHEARTYIEQTAKSTSGVNNINSNEICALKVPIFTLDEQNTIVREIESRLSVCEKVEQTVNQSLQKSESLRQSILKQAFEGKLV